MGRWTELIWQAKSDIVGISRNWLEGVRRSESTGFLLSLRSLEVPQVVTGVRESCSWLSILIFLFFTVRIFQNYCLQDANQSKITLYISSCMIYNLYFHPLSQFPGPWYAVICDVGFGLASPSMLRFKTSQIFLARNLVSGSGPQTMRALHEKYGE
jgi:hypothetical protein